MTRRCSHCSTNGHNSRTCPSRCTSGPSAGTTDASDGGVKLFGVRLTDSPFIKKSLSVGNLLHYHSPTAASPSSDPPRDEGFLSDDPDHGSCSSNRLAERKKGTPWTGEEHRLFLLGLQRLGKGDWRGISRNFVVSRTPTQVASHAQKHFIRQTTSCRKRRSSLFDIPPDTTIGSYPLQREHLVPRLPPPKAIESFTNNADSLPSLDLSLNREAAEPKPEPMEETSSESVHEEPQTLSGELQYSVIPAFFPTFIPYLPFWPVNEPHKVEDNSVVQTNSHHRVVKPTPVIPKEPVNVDELVGMSNLKLSESELGHLRSQISLNLLGNPSRQSAFHASVAASVNNSDQREGESNMIKTV